MTMGGELSVASQWASALRAGDVFEAVLPAVLRTAERLDDAGSRLYVACGSSLDVPEALLSADRGSRALSGGDAEVDGVVAADLLIMVSRSGTTRELLTVARTSPPDVLVTCEPDSPLAAMSKHVVDLAAAQDPGFVAVLSTLVTAGVIAVLEAATDDRERIAEGCLRVFRDLSAVSGPAVGPAVAWLGPWTSAALGRELVRKTLESGRNGVWAHSFEFLHGHEIGAQTDDWTWVLIDTDERAAAFRDYAARASRPRPVVHVAHDWSVEDPVAPVALLARAYELLFADA